MRKRTKSNGKRKGKRVEGQMHLYDDAFMVALRSDCLTLGIQFYD